MDLHFIGPWLRQRAGDFLGKNEHVIRNHWGKLDGNCMEIVENGCGSKPIFPGRLLLTATAMDIHLSKYGISSGWWFQPL